MSADHTHRVHDADTQHQHWKPPVSEDYPDFREYPELHVPRRRRIPIIPDLRLEQGFSKMMQPYIHVLRDPANDKGQEIASEGLGGAVSNEIIEIQWGRVAWITARESIISPLIQGSIRGLAAAVLVPFLNEWLDAPIKAWWNKGRTPNNGQHSEGYGVGWLRTWFAGLTAGSIGGSNQATR